METRNADYTPAVKPLDTGMRWMLYAASALVFTVGIQLFILTEQTDRYFAWTIDPPLTAAFLGAAYWSSFVMEFMAARERLWANARVAVPAVLTFTTLTLVATLLHISRFHIGERFDAVQQFAAWSWIAVYAAVPLIMSVLLIRQLRLPGGDPPRRSPLPSWLRVILGIHAVILLVLGVLFFLAPESVIGLWPWKLTPLTGRAVGAWLLGLGIAASHVAWENDLRRVQVAFASYSILGILQFLALARYPGSVSWGSANTWIYVVFLGSILGAGLYGYFISRRVAQPTLVGATEARG